MSGCLPGRAPPLSLRFLVASSRARWVAVCVFPVRACFFLLPLRVCLSFVSVLSCLRYFVVVNGGLCPFIFQGFLFRLVDFLGVFCA